jgi:hypothetical protein
MIFWMLTHIENGNVNASRDTTVRSMIVVEYGGSNEGYGRAIAKSKNPLESVSTAEVNNVLCDLQDWPVLSDKWEHRR